MSKLITTVQQKTGMDLSVIQNIIKLLDEGNTIPFIARYRKELTEWATDEQLRDFHDLYTYTQNLQKRKEDVIRLIDEKWLLTPELQKEIEEAETLARVEDLYRPFKEKKNTKATIAKAKWLGPLAKILSKANLTKEEFDIEAAKFIKEDKDPKKSVKDVAEAVQWAQDIIAEDVSDHANLREDIKTFESTKADLTTKATKKFEPEGTYKIYSEYNKNFSAIPSYAYLAIARAEKEKQLKIKIWFHMEQILKRSAKYFIPAKANTSKIYIQEAIDDGLKRLLLPSLERELRSDKKKRADEAAIKVFGENMKNLLLIPPVYGKTILWFDPAFRTGCKLAIVDKTGKFLYNTVIYPTAPQNKVVEAEKTLLQLIKEYKIDLIVIWNGTASRESEKIVADIIQRNKLAVEYTITSESGASVYSASKLAQEEYPDLDVTVRWAISIAHRVQDPLAELTKIDPKAIWVWQYQHDVDQKLLQQKLDEKIEDTVNSVWVDANTASYPLLQYVAWLTKKVAQNIVVFRDENGEFTSKKQIKKAKWLWPKAYEQCVWFLRIKNGKEPLDATGIHPEHHKTTYQILEEEFSIKKTKLKLPLDSQLLEGKTAEQIQNLATKYNLGYETLIDIFKELASPGLDPRDSIDTPKFKSDVLDLKDVEVGMTLEWVIRNVTDFGAFVDVGLHQDWLVHISELTNRYVSNPSEVVSVGMPVKVKVLKIDTKTEKISLSMKALESWNQEKKYIRPTINTTNPKTEVSETKLSGNITFS